MSKLENGQIIETAVEARGAERGPTIRNVLVISILLAVVALAVVSVVFLR